MQASRVLQRRVRMIQKGIPLEAIEAHRVACRRELNKTAQPAISSSNQRWLNAGPTLKTLGRRWTSAGQCSGLATSSAIVADTPARTIHRNPSPHKHAAIYWIGLGPDHRLQQTILSYPTRKNTAGVIDAIRFSGKQSTFKSKTPVW